MSDRRTFLRGLASLPLIGGSLAILGQPTAAAVPVTPAIIDRYVAWLAAEHAEAQDEREEIHHPQELGYAQFRREWVRQPMFWFPDDAVAQAAVRATRPSSRAAVILSAAGVPISESGRL